MTGYDLLIVSLAKVFYLLKNLCLGMLILLVFLKLVTPEEPRRRKK